MNQEQRNDRPHDLHHDRALVDHTALLVDAIGANEPAPRLPEAASQQQHGNWRDNLQALGAAIGGLRMRRESGRAVTRLRDGELERVEIVAWAARATGSTGFGGAEASNDGNYFSAA